MVYTIKNWPSIFIKELNLINLKGFLVKVYTKTFKRCFQRKKRYSRLELIGLYLELISEIYWIPMKSILPLWIQIYSSNLNQVKLSIKDALEIVDSKLGSIDYIPLDTITLLNSSFKKNFLLVTKMIFNVSNSSFLQMKI